MSRKKKEAENIKPQAYKLCPNGHKNSPTAKNCWVCGESMDAPAPKPIFIQKTNTVVPTTPTKKLPDVNYVEDECKRYVPGRTRCDETDSSGIPCMYLTMGCVMRAKRFGVKPP